MAAMSTLEMDAVMEASTEAVATLNIEPTATHTVESVEATTGSVSMEVANNEEPDSPVPQYRIPKLKRSLSVGRLMDLLDETERLHRKRKETLAYQGPLLYVPEWIPVPKVPEEPRTKDQKSQTFLPELRPWQSRNTTTEPNAMDKLPICEIPNEVELLTQLYKRTATQKILFGRSIIDEGEELSEEFGRIKPPLERFELDIRAEILRILKETEERQLEIEQQAREEAAWTLYYRLVLEARWERSDAQWSASVLARQKAKEEQRKAMAKQAVEALKNRPKADKAIRQTLVQASPEAEATPSRTVAMTHKSPPRSAAQDREELERIRRQSAPEWERESRRTHMTWAEKKLLRRPATPPRYSISPLRENPQLKMSSLRKAPQRRRSRPIPFRRSDHQRKLRNNQHRQPNSQPRSLGERFYHRHHHLRIIALRFCRLK